MFCLPVFSAVKIPSFFNNEHVCVKGFLSIRLASYVSVSSNRSATACFFFAEDLTPQISSVLGYLTAVLEVT